MSARRDSRRGGELRYESHEPEFQRRWRQSRKLDGDQVDLAFRHGFEARHRFAQRPFYEVEDYLRESWEAMAPPAPWEDVADLVQTGYERYRGAALDYAADLGPEAAERFAPRTAAGSSRGGRHGGPVPRDDAGAGPAGESAPAAGNAPSTPGPEGPGEEGPAAGERDAADARPGSA